MPAPEKLIFAHKFLKDKATTGSTLSYREFAAALGIVKTPIIGTCTHILEALMHQDKLSSKPILAALVVQQGSVGIPRRGFYQTLKTLELYSGTHEGDEALQWHVSEIEKLQTYYQAETP